MSAALRLADVVRWTNGRLRAGDPDRVFPGVSIDTRSIAPGELFVAIHGEHHDAHAFLSGALAAGAGGLLIERGRSAPESASAVVEVDDTTAALGALAAGHRAGFAGPLVAITGSNGKTTTKEMCAAILSVRRPCLRNAGNLNNQYGLPLTLLRRHERHRAVVVELGTNHPGEIAALAAVARPTIGVITNVGTAHIEFLGSREGIAREKGSLLEALPADGTAVLNAEDPLALGQAARTRARIVTFGRVPEATVRGEQVASLGDRGVAFELVAPEGRTSVFVPGLGAATVSNALAAAAAALAAGASLDDVGRGLATFRPVDGRMQRVALPRNVILINDAYNANPQSVEVALRSLAELKGASRGLAVLGDMAELGPEAARAHRESGRLVAQLGLDFLFVLGAHAHETAAGAREAGMNPERIQIGKDYADTASRVREVLAGNDWVLIKGSRSMHMERVVRALAETHEGAG